ncbi:2-hydroxyacid dehydrogenase [Paenibacillus rigui]|uniref:Bifunctional glyoxylate/hydroxypyruvate reductase B n=1 Tax=Paenibacillus rigui TaxID=554312 RepID=A0A229UJ46_9BACL|nr:D-glycerate dehydrogenase [Paenibacillus rigui]OXM82929.1 bifunctional glyoxylate/hydroxypyruvate reductase B [Paenibacillus rigui]
MKPCVYIARNLPEEVKTYLAEHCEVRMWQRNESITPEQLKQEIGDAEGLMVTGTPVQETVLEAAPRLRVVSNLSVGYNNIDVQALKARGIVAAHTPYVLDETVADLAFALMLGTARRVAELDRFVKAGKWRKGQDAELFGVDVHHAKLGIIGMGRIGEAIARRAKLGFLMDVVYYNRSPRPDVEAKLGIAYSPLKDLLQTSDYVLLMTPLTPQTKHLMGEAQFALMKKSAIFINVSRGETVDEQALVQALQQKQIYGAGLDVYEQEPIAPDHPLLAMDQVVALPHLGSATAATRLSMAFAAARNLVHALKGEGPVQVIPELQ